MFYRSFFSFFQIFPAQRDPQGQGRAGRKGGSLPQRIFIAIIPLHEFGDAVVQAPVGFVPAFSLQLGGVGVGLVYVARLHGQEFLLGGLAVGVLDFATADVVNLVGDPVGTI